LVAFVNIQIVCLSEPVNHAPLN